jgi:hypothetical protein
MLLNAIFSFKTQPLVHIGVSVVVRAYLVVRCAGSLSLAWNP